eukprot:evm.model.NODE_7896_length_1596_cov_49.046993.1
MAKEEATGIHPTRNFRKQQKKKQQQQQQQYMYRQQRRSSWVLLLAVFAVALLVLTPTVTAHRTMSELEENMQEPDLSVEVGEAMEILEEAKEKAWDGAQTLMGNEESSRNKAMPPMPGAGGGGGKEYGGAPHAGGKGRPPPRPMPASDKGKEVEKHAREYHDHPPQDGPWWVTSSNQTAGAEQQQQQQQQQPAWKGECDGEWGYEGYAQKAGKSYGRGGGGSSGRPDEEERKEKEELQKRCKEFSEAVTYVQRFEMANPNAAFKVGLNNMSDWTPEEKQTLWGLRRGMVADQGKILNMEDMVTVEKLISGAITYDEVFPSTTDTTAAFSMVDETDSILNEEGGGRRQVQSRGKGSPLPSSSSDSAARSPLSSSSGSAVPEVILPASLDYRYKDANPYGVVAVTPVKQQGTCGR